MTGQLLVQPNDRFAIMPIFVYQRQGWKSEARLESVGFVRRRPVYFFNKYLSVAMEAGFDRRTVPAASTKGGCVSLQSRRRSERVRSSSAGPCCARL